MLYAFVFAAGVVSYPATRWAWQKYAAPKISALVGWFTLLK